MTAIFYATTYGSSREYAEELARRVGTTAVEITPEVAPEVGVGAGPVVVFSPVHGPMIPGVSFVKEHDFGARPVAVVAVGMTLIDEARKKDQLQAALGDARAAVARFYVPGRMNYSELSAAHKSVMFGIINALRLKPRKSENERAMTDAYDKDIDRVDFAELAHIEQWLQQQG